MRFDGAASGYAVLSLSGACPLMKGDFKNLSSLVVDEQAASKYLTVTNTMMVPLISSFGYSATLDVKDMTDLMFKKVGTNGKFLASEVTDLALQGNFSEVVSVKSWTFEDLAGQQQTQYDGLISIDNQNKVKAMLIGEYVNKLVQFNILREVKPLQTPQAGTETATGTRQVCWNNSSFFGLSHDSGCNNVTYEYAVPHDGTSNQQANIIDKIGVLLVDKVEFLHPTSRAFTSTFEIKGSAK